MQSLQKALLLGYLAGLLRKKKVKSIDYRNESVREQHDSYPLDPLAGTSGLSFKDEFGTIRVHDRVYNIKTSRALYETDPRYGDIVDTLVNDVNRGDWEYVVHDDVPRALANTIDEKIKYFMQVLDLYVAMPDIYRESLIDGEVFLQIVVQRNGVSPTGYDVSKLLTLDPVQMERNTDRHDYFVDPKNAFLQHPFGVEVDGNNIRYTNKGVRLMNDDLTNAIGYTFMEIIHARINKRSWSRYGSPRLSRIFNSVRYLQLAERDLGIRSKNRTSAMIAWLYDGQDGSQAFQWMRRMLRKRRDDVERGSELDPTLPAKWQPQIIPGDDTVQYTQDLHWHNDTLYAGSPVPKHMSGYLDDINRDVIPAVINVYNRHLEAETKWLKHQIMLPLIRRMLMIEGIDVDDWMIDVEFPERTEYSVDDIKIAAEIIQLLRNSNVIDEETALNFMDKYAPDSFNADEILESVEEETEEQVEERALNEVDNDSV